MPLAVAGIVKLGVDMMPLTATSTVANNVMPLVAAAPLATAAAVVAKRAAKWCSSQPPQLPLMSPRTAGTVDASPIVWFVVQATYKG